MNRDANGFVLEYYIPITLLDPSAEQHDNIIQFRIPIQESSEVDTILKELVSDAKVILGDRLQISDKTLQQLKENTIACITNYFKS